MENRPEISALLLTVGERTFDEAYQALEAQTTPLSEIIIIRNISPFSAAFNKGVSQVTTPFFIQCDADMILDKNCVEVLFSNFTHNTGMVMGYLRDSLQGRIGGVKLYRTECCRLYPQSDSSNCEKDFTRELIKNKWIVQKIEDSNITLGRHDPDISDPIYNFERFKYLGVKIYARKDWYDLAYRLMRLLRNNKREMATQAILALIFGLYISHPQDHLKIYEASDEYRLWQRIAPRTRIHHEHSKYHSLGIYSFLFGYWNGFCFRLGLKELNMEGLIKDCGCSEQYSLWSYFLGCCSAVMNHSEDIKHNILTRFLTMRPFLIYLKNKLPGHLKTYEAERTIQEQV